MRQGRRLRAVALVVVSLASLGFTGCIQNPPMTVTPVVTGLDHVWDIGFTPDGTMLYTERAGRISAFVGGQKRVLAAPIDVVRQGEAGMMGMAIDPQFATNRFIYVCMVSIQPNPGNDVRLVRWKVNANYTAAAEPRRHRDRRTGERGQQRARAPLRVPAALRTRRPPLRGHRRRGARDRAPGPPLAGRQGAADRPQRQRRARQPRRLPRPAHLVDRAPQRAGHRVPRLGWPGGVHGARPRPRR